MRMILAILLILMLIPTAHASVGEIGPGVHMDKEKIEDIDLFVVMLLNVQEDKVFNLKYNLRYDMNSMPRVKGRRVVVEGVMGSYDEATQTIEFDGSNEVVLAHELAHHYGYDEWWAQWVSKEFYDSAKPYDEWTDTFVGFMSGNVSEMNYEENEPFNPIGDLLGAVIQIPDIFFGLLRAPFTKG